jgi:hypothetical protein
MLKPVGRGGAGLPMRFVQVSTLISALLVVLPGAADAGGRSVTGHGGTLRQPAASIRSPTVAGRNHRFPRHPFAGGVVTDVDVVEVVREVPVGVPVMVRDIPSNTTPVAEPKFVFPPERSAPDPAGSHTVVIQRGSTIEVQSLPLTTTASGRP